MPGRNSAMMDRRHSTSSDSSSISDSQPYRQLSHENIEYIPTRLAKVTASKPAANPLQFVKIGPCDLYRSAQEQIKKAEEVKKIKQEVQKDEEDWQANLDNWKSCRRKRQEHIIERVVEVKKLELEEHDRNRRRSKTFSEMMEERNTRGRKLSLPMYQEENSNDLSDLGIQSPSSKGSISGDDDQCSVTDKEDLGKFDEQRKEHPQNGFNGCHNSTLGAESFSSSPEPPEEYTYERAIQSYVNFTESRVKSRSNNTNGNMKEHQNNECNLSNGVNKKLGKIPPPTPAKPRRDFSQKTDHFDPSRRRSSDSENSKTLDLPKIDILKRRELFEKASEGNGQSSKSNKQSTEDLTNHKSIKERLSNLEKYIEEEIKVSASRSSLLSKESSGTVKDKLPSVEKQRSDDQIITEPINRPFPSEIHFTQAVKEQLTSLGQNKMESQNLSVQSYVTLEEFSSSTKEVGGGRDSSRVKENCKRVTPVREHIYQEKLSNFQNSKDLEAPNSFSVPTNNSEQTSKLFCAESERSVSPEDEIFPSKRQQFHRSLDSLDVEDNKAVDSSFERVQSLEDLECFSSAKGYLPSASSTEMLAFSSQSGDTDREDSGIHTADVSCSVSQADEPIEDTDVIATISSVIPHLEIDKNGRDSFHLEVEIISHKRQDEHLYPVPQEKDEILEESPSDNFGESKISFEAKSFHETSKPGMMDVKVSAQDDTRPLVVVDNETINIPTSRVLESNDDSSFQTPNNSNESEKSVSADDTESLSNTYTNDDQTSDIPNPSPVPIAGGDHVNVQSEKCVDVLKTDNEELPTSLEISVKQPTLSEEKCMSYVDTSLNCGDGGSNLGGAEFSEVKLRIHPEMAGSSNDKRKTVVERCEKVNVEELTKESAKPLLSTPFIDVPHVWADNKKESMQELCSRMLDAEKESLQLQNSPQVEENLLQGTNILSGTSSVLNNNGIDSIFSSNVILQENFSVHSSQIPPLNLTGEIEIVDDLTFPLRPPTSTEPPKEKPPPPPVDISDDDLPEPSLRRLDSTKRIKKEIRKKRSDFLGIEGKTDDSYLEAELQLAPPPDMTSFLVEERRLEQQLYRQSICSESDSNLGETTESRDSGVEMEKQPMSPDIFSADHSRQNSDIYANTSFTSEEDEITKKEREIIETLEKEEQWQYARNNTSEDKDIGEKLAMKLRQLEQEKLQLEWERAEESSQRQAEENARKEEEMRLKLKEQELKEQETLNHYQEKEPSENRTEDDNSSGIALKMERERLQREHEELLKRHESLNQQQQCWSAHVPMHLSLQDISQPHHSLQDIPNATFPQPRTAAPPPPHQSLQDIAALYKQPPLVVKQTFNSRLSLPDLQQAPTPVAHPRNPPPIPPAKPLRTISPEKRDKHVIGEHTESISGQQMSRQTLQALSAAPRSRLITAETWLQAKRKPESQRSSTLNNQHWLIQEAEHRRITEQQQRNAMSPRKSIPPQFGRQDNKPLPDSIIQTLTQRVQNKKSPSRSRVEESPVREVQKPSSNLVKQPQPPVPNGPSLLTSGDSQEKMLSVSGKKKCSHCGEELGRGAAMIIESLRLFYHIDCFKCCVCHVQLGDGLMGTDVRVRNNKLHCHNCYSSDDGVKFSCV